ADRFGRVPLELKMAAINGEIGGDGQLFAGTHAEQGAVVADAEAYFRLNGLSGASANPADDIDLSKGRGGEGSANRAAERHVLRIGQSGTESGISGGELPKNRREWQKTTQSAGQNCFHMLEIRADFAPL